MTHGEYQAKLKELETEMELRELENTSSWNLRHAADRRAIKRWQSAHPGNDHVWPDHADLCVWLMEELDKLEAHHETRS